MIASRMVSPSGSIFFAWLTRSNIIAAILAGALHDVIIPLMPAIYLWEYDVGYWVISHPHHWPTLRHLRFRVAFRLGHEELV